MANRSFKTGSGKSCAVFLAVALLAVGLTGCGSPDAPTAPKENLNTSSSAATSSPEKAYTAYLDGITNEKWDFVVANSTPESVDALVTCYGVMLTLMRKVNANNAGLVAAIDETLKPATLADLDAFVACQSTDQFSKFSKDYATEVNPKRYFVGTTSVFYSKAYGREQTFGYAPLKFDISKFSVDGDVATATIEGRTAEVRLVKTDGKWMVDLTDVYIDRLKQLHQALK